MDFGRSHLPAELLVAVVRGLPVADLKNLRLVCKDLDAVASQFLFETIYISTQLRDRENLTSISAHATFGPTVKEIIYDSTYFSSMNPLERRRFNKTSYTRLFWGMGYRLTETAYTKAAIERGYGHFEACLEDQVDLAAYCGENSTKPTDSASLPTNFSSLLEDPRSHAAMANYLPDDLRRLVEAIPKMPNVKHFAVSDRRHTRNLKHHVVDLIAETGITFSIHNKGIRGLNAVVLDPSPWPESDYLLGPGDRRWYRGFSVLMQAASMTKMEKLESFNVQCDSDCSGLSHSILNMSSSELHHTSNAFRNLRRISLKIDSKPVIDGEGLVFFELWSASLASGSIAKILGTATHLEHLELMLDDSFDEPPNAVDAFAKFIGTTTWTHLRSLGLGHMVLHENEFLDLFNRHRQTLQSLRLDQVNLFPETRTTQSPENNNKHSWYGTLRAMAVDTIALTSFDMHFHDWLALGSGSAACINHHARGAANVLQFLQAGGVETKRLSRSHSKQNGRALALLSEF